MTRPPLVANHSRPRPFLEARRVTEALVAHLQPVADTPAIHKVRGGGLEPPLPAKPDSKSIGRRRFLRRTIACEATGAESRSRRCRSRRGSAGLWWDLLAIWRKAV